MPHQRRIRLRLLAAWGALIVIGLGLALLPEPVTVEIRHPLGMVLLVAAAASMAAGWLGRAAIRFAVALALAVSAAWLTMQPGLDLAAVLADPSPSAAARRLVVGYDDPEVVRSLARRGRIGGVFLTRRNVTGRTEEDVAVEIASFQAAARAGGFPPLVIAADQEGGAVSHLSPPLPSVAALSDLAGLPPTTRATAARALGRSAGEALRRLGITADLAPVVDLKPTEAPDRFDLHTRIATRAISADPAIVADVASAFARGLLDQGIMPVAKHFPGLGSVHADTHVLAAANDRPIESLQASDWIPFEALAQIPGAAVMVSHAALSAIDPGIPASQSRRVVDDVLRRGIGFGGAVVTDDMTMGAVVHAGLCRGITRALRAGVDIVLVSWDVDKVPTAIRCALAAEAAGLPDHHHAERASALSGSTSGGVASPDPP